MIPRTHFSFEINASACTDLGQGQQGETMASLEPALQKLLTAQDSQASVAISDSHKGAGSKIAELTTSLQDAQIADILKAFSAQHGVTVTALE